MYILVDILRRLTSWYKITTTAARPATAPKQKAAMTRLSSATILMGRPKKYRILEIPEAAASTIEPVAIRCAYGDESDMVLTEQPQ